MTRKKLSKRVVLIGMSGLLLAACGGRHDDSAGGMSAMLEHKQKLDRRLNRVLDRLEATPAQRKQVHQLKAELIGKALPLHRSRGKLADKARAEWQSSSPDRQGLHQAVDRQFEMIRTFVHAVVDKGVELHGILTAEQRAKLLQLIDQVRQMHRLWHG